MTKRSRRAGPPPRRSRRRWLAGGLVAALVITGAAGLGLSRGTTQPAPLSEIEARGQVLYEANCASCHGTTGVGQPRWKSARPDGTRPAPPHDPGGHTWHHPDAVLFGIVKHGGTFGAPPGYRATMPAYSGILSDAQIIEVLTYIKTMWGERERQYQATMSEMGAFPAETK